MYSGLALSTFHTSKDKMVEPTCEQLNTWIQCGGEVKTIRCDNVGGNKKLETAYKAKEWQLPVNFEYTARAIPQQNSVVEKTFDTLASCSRSVMAGANIPDEIRQYVSKECLNCVTLVDGLIFRIINKKTATRCEHWSNELPKFANHLKEWGEAGVLTICDIKTSKLTNKGKLGMFIGYSPQHAGDYY